MKRSRVRTKKANPASAVGSVSSTKEGRKGGKRAGKKKEKMASSAGGRRKRLMLQLALVRLQVRV